MKRRDGVYVKSESLIDVLGNHAAFIPEHLLYTFLPEGEREDGLLTFADLDKKAKQIGALLAEYNLRGERALLLYNPGLEYIAAFMGCLYAGVIAVPAYPPRNNRNLPRLQAIIDDAQAKIALTSQSLVGKIEGMFAEVEALKSVKIFATDVPLDGYEEKWCHPGITSDYLAFLQYTSGSTGNPKGVMLSHGNLLHNLGMIQECYAINEDTVGIIWLPPYHDMGLIGGFLAVIYAGAQTVYMPPAAFLQRPIRLLEAMTKFKGTVSGGPNFMYDLLVNKTTLEQRAGLDLSSWQVAFNGAEPIRWETLERFSRTFAPYGFNPKAHLPCYGLAEGTVLVSSSRALVGPAMANLDKKALEQNRLVETGETENARLFVSSGFYTGDQAVKIVNPDTFVEMPDGELGEIWVKGPSISRGYWNRPQESQKTFSNYIAGGGAATGDGPFLRTEDRGFWKNGQLYIAGRIKDLIIIRGVNHYPQDIERTVETCHPSLRLGSGAAFSVEADGEEKLVIAHEIEFRENPDIHEVAEAMRQVVAEQHELQLFGLVLVKPGHIPKTSSGKIQRRATRTSYLEDTLETVAVWHAGGENGTAVPVADNPGEEKTARVVSPRQKEIEHWLAEKLATELNIPATDIDVMLPFTRYGLDSVGATVLAGDLQAWLGRALSPSLLYNYPTIEKLAGFLCEETKTIPATAIRTAMRVDYGTFPLSKGQEALWVQHQVAPKSIFNPVYAVRVRGRLDQEALHRSLQLVVNRHPSLRTTFHLNDGQHVQRVHEYMDAHFMHEDVSGLDETAVQQRVETIANQPFDLTKGPLFRTTLLERTPDDLILIVAVHHIVVDMWSLAIIVNELGQLYQNPNRDFALLPVNLRYTDYVAWQNEQLNGAEGERLANYWLKNLAGPLAVIEVPTDFARPPIQTFNGKIRTSGLGLDLTEKLKQLSETRGVTLYMTLLAAYKILLHKYTGLEDIVVGTPTIGRSRAELADIVGYFVNPVALRSQVNKRESFDAFINRVQQTVVSALAHQDYPFYRLVEKLTPARETSRTPVFTSMFVYQRAHLLNDTGLSSVALGMEGQEMDFAGLPLSVMPIEEQVSPFDMTWMAAETSGGLGLSLTFNTDLYAESTALRLLDQYKTLLENIIEHPDWPISALQVVPEAELHNVLFSWNNTQVPLPENPSIQQLFHQQVDATPDAEAVVFENSRLTYAELDKRANQLAHYLIARGVGPEKVVGLCVDRSLETVIGLLGILKAGGAYMPLDPYYPKDRLQYMIEHSRVQTVVSMSALKEQLPSFSGEYLFLDKKQAEMTALPENRPAIELAPNNLAYIIYTSGSTGQPKGVMLTHEGLVNLVLAQIKIFAVKQTSRVLQYASFSFDASVSEIFMALISGASLTMISRETMLSQKGLLAALQTNEITTVTLPPSILAVLPETELPKLATIISAGEACSKNIVQRWKKGRRFVNAYGPTESTVCTTANVVDEVKSDNIPIGVPIDNLHVYIVDADFNPVPIGVPGELLIGGIGLARGYFDRPDLTAERFIPNPWAERPGERLYRSGDLVRYLVDGKIEFLGRIDHQVKINGLRVELGEIENTLLAHPNVENAVVLARRVKSGGDTRLAAYYIAKNGKDIPFDELAAFMKKKLPPYMAPSSYLRMSEFPLTQNKKIDRQAFPDPFFRQQVNRTDIVRPKNEIERTIAEAWCKVLDLNQISIHDNFFEIGGHSLTMVKLHAILQEKLATDMSIVELFQYPTIASQAKFLSSNRNDDRVTKNAEIRAQRQRNQMLTQRTRFGLEKKVEPARSGNLLRQSRPIREIS